MTNIISVATGKKLLPAKLGNTAAKTQEFVAKQYNAVQATKLLSDVAEDAKTEAFVKLRAEVKELNSFKGSNLAKNYTLMALERIAHKMAIAEPKAVEVKEEKPAKAGKEVVTA